VSSAGLVRIKVGNTTILLHAVMSRNMFKPTACAFISQQLPISNFSALDDSTVLYYLHFSRATMSFLTDKTLLFKFQRIITEMG